MYRIYPQRLAFDVLQLGQSSVAAAAGCRFGNTGLGAQKLGIYLMIPGECPVPRPVQHHTATLDSIMRKTGWAPRSAYFNTLRASPPVFKAFILRKEILPNYAPSELLAIESNPATRRMSVPRVIRAGCRDCTSASPDTLPQRHYINSDFLGDSHESIQANLSTDAYRGLLRKVSPGHRIGAALPDPRTLDELTDAAQEVSDRGRAATAAQNKRRTNDAVMTTVGLIVFWP
jgi:hypothetical protein